jgi:hypothetical protein
MAALSFSLFRKHFDVDGTAMTTTRLPCECINQDLEATSRRIDKTFKNESLGIVSIKFKMPTFILKSYQIKARIFISTIPTSILSIMATSISPLNKHKRVHLNCQKYSIQLELDTSRPNVAVLTVNINIKNSPIV